MKNPLLSICIATYNRADYIGTTLESIIPQLNDEVELLVVDGASTDTTEEVVQRYVRNNDHVRYIRLPKKGGVDQDYDLCVERSRGEMCWLFTDDDLLKSGAVESVLKAIKEGYGLLIVNAEICSRDLSGILQSRRLPMLQNKTYTADENENLFIDTIGYLSFIGALVIRRSVWLGRNRKHYYGTEFIHVGVLFQEPLLESSILIADPLISIRYGNAQWASRSFDIWMFKWPQLVWSFQHYSDQAKELSARKEPWRNFKDLIIQRSIGVYTLQSYRQYLSSKNTSGMWKLCAWLISWFPRYIIIPFYYVYSRRNLQSKSYFDNEFRK